MRRHQTPLLLSAFAALVSATPNALAQGPPSSAADYLPEGLVLVATLRDGDRQVAALRELLNEHDFYDSQPAQTILENPEIMQARVGLAGIAATAGLDLWTAGDVVLGRELAFGLRPRESGKPEVILATVSRQPEALDRLLTAVHALTGLEAGGEPDESRSHLVDGVRVYAAKSDVMHCRVDDALIVSNSRALMDAALGARRSNAVLARAASYRKAREQVPADAVLWAYADMTAIRGALGEAGGELPEKLPNPLAGFLFGGSWHAIRHADAVVAWAQAGDGALKIEARVASREPMPESHRGFVMKDPAAAGWSADTLPRFIGEISVTRQWADLFADREALLTLPAAADVVNFSNSLTTLFGQVDFMDEILPIVNGPVRLVAARQDFSDSPFVPSPKLPAFALITPLKTGGDANLARRLRSGTLTAFSLLSADAAQKKQPGYFVETDRYRGHHIYYTEYSRPATEGMRMDAPKRVPQGDEEEDGAVPGAAEPAEKPMAGVRYNFAPAAAVIEDHYVLATSAQMLRDVIDAIAEPATVGAAEGADLLRINVREVVAALRENRHELVVNNMLEKDHAKREAEREIDALLGVLDFFDSLELTSRLTDRALHAEVLVKLRSEAK